MESFLYLSPVPEMFNNKEGVGETLVWMPEKKVIKGEVYPLSVELKNTSLNVIKW